jgi:hypothetical protein
VPLKFCRKVGNSSQSEDTLLPDILFAQINANASGSGAGRDWTPPHVFDLLWESAMRLRVGIVQCLVPDAFAIVENVLPNEYLQFICMQSFNLVPYLLERQNSLMVRETRSDFFVNKKQLEDNEVGGFGFCETSHL